MTDDGAIRVVCFEDGLTVYSRCPLCGRWIKTGEAWINGLEETKLTGWICAKHGEVQPVYEYL